MRTSAFGIRAKIRALALGVPLLAGCSGTDSHMSCEGFKSETKEDRLPKPAADAGADPLASEADCAAFCQIHQGYGRDFRCSEADDAAETIVCEYKTTCTGRYPEGFSPPCPDPAAPVLGGYFARMAAGEAASVVAFNRLAEELAELGLPAGLVRRARRAARQEARHHRLTARLARRFGGDPRRGTIAPRAPRTLLAVALENVREGLVRESFGAVAGYFQAHHAADPAVREVMHGIADDEASHAELSFAIDAAARERLSEAECALLDRELAEARDRLREELEADVNAVLVERAGLPDRRTARALLDAARAELWS